MPLMLLLSLMMLLPMVLLMFLLPTRSLLLILGTAAGSPPHPQLTGALERAHTQTREAGPSVDLRRRGEVRHGPGTRGHRASPPIHEQSNTISTRWAPSHRGIACNEIADLYARAAVESGLMDSVDHRIAPRTSRALGHRAGDPAMAAGHQRENVVKRVRRDCMLNF